MADIETRLNTDIAHLSFLLNGHIGCDWRTGRPFTLHTKSDGDFYELQRALAALQDARAEILSLRQQLETARAEGREAGLEALVLTKLIGDHLAEAPDDAEVWIGGYSTYSGVRDETRVHVSDIRSALTPHIGGA